MNGKVFLYENDKLIYEGNFVDNLYHGKGKLLQNNGDRLVYTIISQNNKSC